jgi:hypothetical protein
MPKRRGKGNNQHHQYAPTNFYDVLIKLINGFYALLNNGNFIGAVIGFILIWIIFVTDKVSQSFLEKMITQALSHNMFYIIPMGFALCFSLFSNYLQAKIYKAHIKTLTDTRKELIHGLKSGEIKHLKRETTSGINPLEIDDDC